MCSVRRGSPDPAEGATAGLLLFPETCGRILWLGQETGHNNDLLVWENDLTQEQVRNLLHDDEAMHLPSRVGRKQQQPISVREGLRQIGDEEPAIQREEVMWRQPAVLPADVVETRTLTGERREGFSRRRRRDDEISPARSRSRHTKHLDSDRIRTHVVTVRGCEVFEVQYWQPKSAGGTLVTP